MPGKPRILQQSWSKGMRTDVAPEQVGENAAASIVDWIPDLLGAPLEKRGGWEYQGGTLIVTGSTEADWITGLVHAPFNGGSQLVAVDNDGKVFRNAGPGATWTVEDDTSPSAVEAADQNPVFIRDSLVFPAATSAGSAYSGNEDSLAAFTGMTTAITRVADYNGRAVGAYDETILFGPPGEPDTETWDADATYDRTQPVVGLWGIQGGLLVFHPGSVELLRGAIPIGYGIDDPNDTDVDIRTIFPDVGLLDAFSLCGWNDLVIWANRTGVFMTDGASPVDLTYHGEYKRAWVESLDGYGPTWRIAAGVFKDLLIINVLNASRTLVKCHVCYLPRRIWWQFSNMPFMTFAQSRSGQDELWAGTSTTDAGRVAALGDILNAPGANGADANGTDILPVAYSFHAFGAHPQTVHDVYLGYQITEGDGYEGEWGGGEGGEGEGE